MSKTKTKPKISKNVKILLFTIFTLIIIGSIIIIFTTFNKSTTTEPETLESNQSDLTEIKINTSSGKVIVYSELAQTNEERQQGLMNRTELEEDRGMLFIFPKEQMFTFWMKNTLIPLDIIFIDKEKTIINIAENTKTNQTSEVYSSKRKGLYVLEVNGGWCKRNGVKAGDNVEFNIEN